MKSDNKQYVNCLSKQHASKLTALKGKGKKGNKGEMFNMQASKVLVPLEKWLVTGD